MKKKLLVNKLVNIYGIGKNLTFNIFKKVGLNKTQQLTHIKKKQRNFLLKMTKKVLINRYLKDEISKFIDFSNKIRTYRGMRNRLHYPCRGQRTHTNGKTKRKRFRIL